MLLILSEVLIFDFLFHHGNLFSKSLKITGFEIGVTSKRSSGIISLQFLVRSVVKTDYRKLPSVNWYEGRVL